MTPAEIVQLVAKSRAEQGLPKRVEDPSALDRIARLIAGQKATTERRRAS